MSKQLSVARFTDLTSEEIASLRSTGHSTSVEVSEGAHVDAKGYYGVIRGGLQGVWLTGRYVVDRVAKTSTFVPDGRAY